MANHFPKFFEFFKDYQDAYVLIGGQPRATQDLDIIVVFENITQQFVDRF
ncbi:hypothetical protein [Secundilactobacillus kimchicus]|nr:hypothetical protein [Secundilactobacillus kimchicus]